MTCRQYPAPMPTTLLDLLDEAVARYGDRSALSLRADDGSTGSWSFRELERRGRLAAWRLRATGLEPGDRVLTWSPSTPELAAAYFGAMRARLIYVPLDLRMSVEAIEGIVRASEAHHLVLGTGRDAPDPREARLEHFPTTTADALCAEPTPGDPLFPPDWETQQAAWEPPATSEIFQLVFTSGTTGLPKCVMHAQQRWFEFHRLAVAAADLTAAAVFPEHARVWEFNYRGDLVFLRQAQAQAEARHLFVTDGWVYFLHGWTRVISDVFAVAIPTRGPVFDELSKIAAATR